jgi:hypothetical protein
MGADEKAKAPAAENFAAAPPPEPAASGMPEARYAEATGAPGEGRSAGAPAAADEAELGALARDDEQRPAKRKTNCEAERAKYDDLAAHDSPGVNDAKWELARCYDASGRVDQARSAYTALLMAPSYSERAKRALDQLPRARAAAPASPAKAGAAAKPAAASPPAATQAP